MNTGGLQNEDLRELYRELILDHARSPRHFGKMPAATHFAEGVNPLCGDKLTLYVCVDSDGLISDACFEGTGCAISVASASLMTETVIGMSTDDALTFFSALVERLSGTPPGNGHSATSSVELGKLRALEGVKEFPSRVKCATLAWHAFNSAINDSGATASTEQLA